MELITITCNEDVRFLSMSPGDVKIEIDGPLAPYAFEFKVDDTTGFFPGKISRTFSIVLRFKSSLAGSSQGNIF